MAEDRNNDEIIEAAVRPAGVDGTERDRAASEGIPSGESARESPAGPTEPGVMPPPPDLARVPVRNKGLITVSVMLATIMQALDTTIANVALPKVQGTL